MSAKKAKKTRPTIAITVFSGGSSPGQVEGAGVGTAPGAAAIPGTLATPTPRPRTGPVPLDLDELARQAAAAGGGGTPPTPQDLGDLPAAASPRVARSTREHRGLPG